MEFEAAMTDPVAEKPKKVRKNRYIPDLAAASFKPTQDWSVEEARKMFDAAKFPRKVDEVSYEECVSGMQKLPDASIALVIADPPFGLRFSGKESIYNRDSRYVSEGYREVGEEYEEFSNKWIGEIPRILKDSGSAWIFSGWTHIGEILNAVKKSKLTVTNHIIWRYQFGVFTSRKFVTSHYHLLFLTKSQDYYFNKILHYPQDVWDINRTYRQGEVKNGTKLPERLITRCIDFTSRPGDLILDPFMGNGTTAVAALGTFRHFIGFEVNRNMESVISRNLQMVKLGEFYTPYSSREDELVTRARKKHGTPGQNATLS
jgi:site-specific DNA-methyltransferase (adenine-specific)